MKMNISRVILGFLINLILKNSSKLKSHITKRCLKESYDSDETFNNILLDSDIKINSNQDYNDFWHKSALYHQSNDYTKKLSIKRIELVSNLN